MKHQRTLKNGLLGLACIFSPLVFAAVAIPLEALPTTVPAPADNPVTPEKVKLGKMLYFDTRLSSTQKVSCNTCHNVAKGGDDNRSVSVGINGKTGNRSAPTVWNAAFMSVQFWDGRAATLEDQAKGPMVNPVEMGMPNHQAVVDRLKKSKEYVELFKQAFGGEDSLNIENVAKAIASYERTLVTPDSPFDLYLKGKKNALSPAAVRGMNLVQEVGCTTCHNGPNFAGPVLPVGTGNYRKFPTFPGSEYETKYKLTEDLGRFQVTHQEADKNLFRIPTWRNVALTAPYFHNGSVKTLDEAVRVMAKTQLNRTLSDAETKDIVEFLKSLTGKRPAQPAPKLPK
ncbi:MAG: cytochrome-c peroxidase [Bdellovibrio sp.]|nr:cytochrome-c peroxidase [Bdellovibrio sp.]